MNIKDFVQGKKLRILLKGGSGSGKSIQAGSFPNVYFFDFDDRIDSVVKYFIGLGKTDIDFDYYPVNQLEKAHAKMKAWVRSKCPYDTVVIDTTTTLIESVLHYIDAQKMSGGKGGDKKGMDISLGFINAPALDDYKFLKAAVTEIITMSKDLKDTHVIYNAHVMYQQAVAMDGTVTNKRVLLAPGKTAQEIPIHFNEIYHLDVERSLVVGKPARRILITEANGIDEARTALPLPRTLDVTEKLLWEQLCEYVPTIRGGTKAENKTA